MYFLVLETMYLASIASLKKFFVGQNFCRAKIWSGGLEIRTQHFHLCDLGSVPDLGTEIPHQAAAHHGQKEKGKKM